jgi:histidine ammonia-lyase
LLGVVASQALHVTGRAARSAPLAAVLETIRAHVPPVTEDRVLGPEIGRLCEALRKDIYPPD